MAILKSGTPALLVALLSLIIPADLYADTGTWVDGDMPTLSVGEVSTTPPQATGSCFKATYAYFKYDTSLPNSSGHTIDTTGCEIQNDMGSFINSNPNNTGDSYDFIKPGTSIAFRVLRGESRPASIISAPNQSSFFWEEPSNYWGSPVIPHFFSNFAAAGDFGKHATGSGYELAYNLNTNGSLLTDSKGTKLYMHAYAFSQNGAWMVAEIDGTGLVRINLQTLQTTLFSTTYLAYNLGFGHNLQLAVSDDGNAAIMGHDSSVNTTVFDLSGCQGGPFVVGSTSNNAAISGCRSRIVQADLQAKLTNFQYLQGMRFSPDGKSIAAVAVTTGLNGIKLYNRITYSVAGYQPPHVSYLALGDSFSSGEGAYDYVLGTNEPENTCHVSINGYPYLVAEALGITDSFHNVACSGAEVKDYLGPQHLFGYISDTSRNSLGVWEPGYQGQMSYLTQAGHSSVVTISMIGNDIGFQTKLLQCLSPTDSCLHFQEDRESVAAEIYGKFDTLYQLYTSIKNNSGNKDTVKVFVLGYPQIMADGPDCGVNPAVVPFNQEERQMAQELISYLNAVIKAAAIKAGVQYIDVEHAFAGHMLCEAGTKAVNGVTIDNNIPDLLSKANSSFHPNVLGHQLMSQALLSQSENFTKIMPVADDTKQAPYSESQEYAAFVDSAPSGGTFSHLLYEAGGVTTLGYKAASIPVNIVDQSLKQNSQFQVWFHSTATFAGTLTSDAEGHLIGQVMVPGGLAPGYHTVDFVGKNVADEDIDVYAPVYIAASADDYDGDGIPNSQDSCSTIVNSGIDSDHDGIDDACDGDIAPAPADTVPPQVLGVADRQPDRNGWYNNDVMINWSAVDPDPSSGSPTQPDPMLANREGDNTYTSGESCDPAANCATGSLEVKLDKTAPDITFTIEPAPNANGWNNSAATVHFACTDALSGIENCTEPIVVFGSDGSYVVTGYATDNAGNTFSVNAVVNLDATAPQITNALSSEPNQYGWHNSGVTVTPSCSDNLSGIATCSQPVTVGQEGVTQTVVSSATDYAGNTSSVSTVVNIDKTPPTIDSLSWTNNPKATLGIATLSARAMDNLSGVLAAEYFLGDIDPGVGHGTSMAAVDGTFAAIFGSDLPTGVYRISVRVQDRAGNWSMLTSDYLVVYNPFSTNMTGRKFVVPSFASGDSLPGLATNSQADKASFGFNVGYDAHGQLLHSSGLEFSYATGSECNKPSKAQNCHSLTLSASSIAWFVTQGGNNSAGIFEGSGVLSVDGAQQPVNFWVTGVDGERLDATSPDHIQLQIFTPSQNPASDTPIYQINDDVLRGNIHIRA